MRKIQIVGLALVAVFALSAIAASTAFGATYLWLVGAKHIEGTEEIPSEAEGELLLLELFTGLEVLCSGFFDGALLPNGLDVISEVLNLEKLLVAGSLTNADLLICEEHKVCQGTMEIDVEAINLPWSTQLMLVGTVLVNLITATTNGNPGYHVKCLTLLGESNGECTGEGGPEVLNVEGGVEGVFKEEETGLCTFSGSMTGDISGTGITRSSAGTVTISEE